MMFYDAELSKINAEYHQESLTRSMRSSREDFELLGNAWKNMIQAIRNQFRSSAKPNPAAPLGDIQANLS